MGGGRLNAYVLVQTSGEGKPIAERLQAIPGVLSAEDLTGAYDAIAITQAASTQYLVQHVIAEILNLPCVTRALPAPVIRSLRQRPRDERPTKVPGTRDEAA